MVKRNLYRSIAVIILTAVFLVGARFVYHEYVPFYAKAILFFTIYNYLYGNNDAA